MGEPLLQFGNYAESLGVYFPGDSGPEHCDAVRQAVHAHAVFGVERRLLEPENGSVVRFFYVYVSVAACDILKRFEFFHTNFSLR